MEIRLSHVTMTYFGGKTALKDLSLALHSPGLYGLLGPNGAGKSTLLKLLSASLLPTSGSVEIDGQPLPAAEKRLKAGLGYLPQDFGLLEELTAGQFLDYMAALKGLSNPQEAIKKALRAVRLEEHERTRIRSLSGGQRQRTGIAQALLGDPPFLMFDEPTVGLDPEERMRFRSLLASAAKERLVLLSTHIIEDVQSICGSLMVLHHGILLFSGSPEELVRSGPDAGRWFHSPNTGRQLYAPDICLDDSGSSFVSPMEAAYLSLLSGEVSV